MKSTGTVFLIVMILLGGLSCKGQVKKRTYNLEAINFNDQAVEIISKNHENSDSLRKAIQLLDQAIKLDSSNYMPYANKANVLCSLGDYKGSIVTLQKILSIDSSNLELKTYMGFMLEKTGKLSDAMTVYKSVLHSYDQKIGLEPNNINIKVNRSLMILLIEGKDKGVFEYRQLATKYPSNQSIKLMEELFVSFDRVNFINSICSEQHAP